LIAIEALVAAQAVDLRQAGPLGAGTRLVLDALRAAVPALAEDRPPGPDAARVEAVLFADPLVAALGVLAVGGEDTGSLHPLLC
jgi:histidine ammonia-lyase